MKFFRACFFISFLCLTSYVFAPTLMIYSNPSGKAVYCPQHAGNTGKSILLLYRLQEYVKHSAYQKRYGVTFCNVFARDILDPREKKVKRYCFFWNDYKYDLSPVFPRINSIYMNIQKAYRRALEAVKKGVIKYRTMKQAQTRVNQGVLIWGVSAKYNHEFLVAPGEWIPGKGCMVAQAGDSNGIFRISDREVFGKNWKDPEIRFYEFKESEE